MKTILFVIRYTIAAIFYAIAILSFILAIDPDSAPLRADNPIALIAAILSYAAAVFTMCYERKS